jgi:hydroxyacyl-ACP dehydratase HTD2-like protein with hotdog domain
MTLGRPGLYSSPNPLSIATSAPPAGTPLPPGYHLVYFTPSALEKDLGADGSDRTFNPMIPFTRRMWAGGELRWEKENPLRIGQVVRERTKLLSAEPKVTKTGEEMIVVGVEKSFENESGLSLVDKRNWIFRKEITSPTPPAMKPVEVPLPQGKFFKPT